MIDLKIRRSPYPKNYMSSGKKRITILKFYEFAVKVFAFSLPFIIFADTIEILLDQKF